MRLTNKIAVVTGASGGIGAAIARRFVKEGASVVLADLSEEGLAEAARGLPAHQVATIRMDVSDPEDVKRGVQLAVERFGGLDVMVANAGIEGAVAPLVDQSVDEFDKVLAVNVRGAFLSVKYAAPLIAKRGGGSILITSSVAGLVGSKGLGPYVASKHAVMGLVKSAAAELASLGIRVVAINPGPIENRMMRSIEEQAAPGAANAVKQGFLSQVPMGRYGTNDEIAALAAFLASDDAGYCTGTSFVADGGLTAQ